MHISKITFALAALQTVTAHTLFTTLYINDVDQGDGTCVRQPKEVGIATAPVNDLTSTDMACGRDGTVGVARVCSVSKASKLSFEFRVWPDASNPGSIDPRHVGSCSVYMKNTVSAINDTAAGDGWFKIFAEGYDESTSQWCTDKLVANNGILSVQIPDNLAGGEYLVRPEILALQEADKGNPQFYAGCAQIFLDSTATTLPSDTVSIPGAVKITDPAAVFNIYEPTKFPFPYPLPGPETYVPGTSASKEVAAVTTQTEGLPIPNTILTVANWMAAEIPQFSDAEGCTASARSCWAQTKVCYDSAPPTGGKLCKNMEDKCTAVDKVCSAGGTAGVPNFGTDITPKPANRFPIPDAANAGSAAAPVAPILKDTSSVAAPTAPLASKSSSSTPATQTPVTTQAPTTIEAPATHTATADPEIVYVTVTVTASAQPAPTTEAKEEIGNYRYIRRSKRGGKWVR